MEVGQEKILSTVFPWPWIAYILSLAQIAKPRVVSESSVRYSVSYNYKLGKSVPTEKSLMLPSLKPLRHILGHIDTGEAKLREGR